MRVLITAELAYDLSEPLLDTYGTKNLEECVQIDMEVDAAAVLLDAEVTVISVRKSSLEDSDG
jgi:hypothetical protein